MEAYIKILKEKDGSVRLSKLNTNKNMIGRTEPHSIYKHGHLLASHSILQEEQAQLNQKYSLEPYKKLAIDEYGLMGINVFLGPKKVQHSFGWGAERSFIYFSKLMIQEFERHMGPLRMVFVLQEQVIRLFKTQITRVRT